MAGLLRNFRGGVLSASSTSLATIRKRRGEVRWFVHHLLTGGCDISGRAQRSAALSSNRFLGGD
jgi:hypothetical protein